MVEHNLGVVPTSPTTITVLARGKVLAEGDYHAVSRDPQVVRGLSRNRPWLRPRVRPPGPRGPALAGRRRPASLVWRIPCAAWHRLRCPPGRGGHLARPQRRGQDDDAQDRSWAWSGAGGAPSASRRELIGLRLATSRGWASPSAPRSAASSLEPQRRGESDAAPGMCARAASRSMRFSSSFPI